MFPIVRPGIPSGSSRTGGRLGLDKARTRGALPRSCPGLRCTGACGISPQLRMKRRTGSIPTSRPNRLGTAWFWIKICISNYRS